MIDDAKVRDYLLSPSHAVGRFKARLFGYLGYTRGAWEILASDLRDHAIDGEATEVGSSPYGRKFEVRGRLVGPNGRSIDLVSIWIILLGADAPRFVTAFPE